MGLEMYFETRSTLLNNLHTEKKLYTIVVRNRHFTTTPAS
jgi:hypothetical protein